MSAAADPTGLDIPKGRTYLKHNQVLDLRDEIAGIQATMSDPKSRIEDRGEMRRRLQGLENNLSAGCPPEVTPTQRDAVAREAKEIRDRVVPEMLSHEEMRKCPSGAIGWEAKFQARNKALILRYKNLMRILHRDDPDPDVASLERFRGKTNRLNLEDAQIPGKQFFIPPDTPEYKDNHDRTFKQGDYAPLADQQAEIDVLRAQVAELISKVDATPVLPESPTEQTFASSAPCGREFAGKKQHYADNAVRMHKRKCKGCAETEAA